MTVRGTYDSDATNLESHGYACSTRVMRGAFPSYLSSSRHPLFSQSTGRRDAIVVLDWVQKGKRKRLCNLGRAYLKLPEQQQRFACTVHRTASYRTCVTGFYCSFNGPILDLLIQWSGVPHMFPCRFQKTDVCWGDAMTARSVCLRQVHR